MAETDVGSYNSDYTTAAAINAGSQLLMSSMNGALASINSKEDRKYNTRVRAENRQWALEDYERLLADSSPKSQIERLKSAGLNANLVYGSGNIQTGVTSMPREALMPNTHRVPFQLDLAAANALGNFLDLKLKEAEIKKTESESNKAETEAEKNRAATVGLNIDNDVKEATSTALKLQPYLQNELTEAEINRTQETVQLIKSEIDLNQNQIELLTNQILEIQARIDEIHARTDLTREQIITEAFKQDELQASAYAHRAQASLTPAMISMYTAIARLNNSDADFKESNRDVLRAKLINESNYISEQSSESVQRQNLTQEEIESERFTRKNKLFNDLLEAGDIILRVYDAKTRRLGATRPRSSSTTVYDKRGNMSSRTETRSY